MKYQKKGGKSGAVAKCKMLDHMVDLPNVSDRDFRIQAKCLKHLNWSTLCVRLGREFIRASVGKKSVRTIDEALTGLTAAGYMTKLRRGAGPGNPTTYRVNIEQFDDDGAGSHERSAEVPGELVGQSARARPMRTALTEATAQTGSELTGPPELQEMKKILESQVGPDAWYSWFVGLKWLSVDDGTVKLQARSGFVRKNLIDKYKEVLRDAAQQAGFRNVQITVADQAGKRQTGGEVFPHPLKPRGEAIVAKTAPRGTQPMPAQGDLWPIHQAATAPGKFDAEPSSDGLRRKTEGGCWYVRLYVLGNEFEVSLGTTDYERAKPLRQELQPAVNEYTAAVHREVPEPDARAELIRAVERLRESEHRRRRAQMFIDDRGKDADLTGNDEHQASG